MTGDDDTTTDVGLTAYAAVGALLQLGLMELLIAKGVISEPEVKTLYRNAETRLFDVPLQDASVRIASEILQRLSQRPIGKPDDDVRRLFGVT